MYIWIFCTPVCILSIYVYIYTYVYKHSTCISICVFICAYVRVCIYIYISRKGRFTLRIEGFRLVQGRAFGYSIIRPAEGILRKVYVQDVMQATLGISCTPTRTWALWKDFSRGHHLSSSKNQRFVLSL